MSVSTRTRFEVLKRDGFRCRYCGLTAMATELHVDHVVPASKGGTDDPVNLVAACAARAAELHALIREGSESWEDVQIMLRELVEMASQ